jgi:hypothetical protein
MSKKKLVSGFGVKLLVVAACFAARFPLGQQAAEPTAADKLSRLERLTPGCRCHHE